MLDLEIGLHYDESNRTLAEVTNSLYEMLVDEDLFDPTPDDLQIYEQIIPDSHTGIWHYLGDDYEFLHELYEDLVTIVTDNLPDDHYFAYENDGGGWGVWTYEGELI